MNIQKKLIIRCIKQQIGFKVNKRTIDNIFRYFRRKLSNEDQNIIISQMRDWCRIELREHSSVVLHLKQDKSEIAHLSIKSSCWSDNFLPVAGYRSGVDIEFISGISQNEWIGIIEEIGALPMHLTYNGGNIQKYIQELSGQNQKST